ncbi:MAG: YdaS family helix-turn-helix protein [Candidatus Sedimenticola sp. (ex Thyasira tokunagai)]
MDIKEIIKEAGGASAISGYCGISKQAPGQWKEVPIKQVLKIYLGCKGGITPHQMRPDIYPDPNWIPTEEQATSALTA